jgi:glutamate-1-semialdehyde 2,1-aminomutase
MATKTNYTRQKSLELFKEAQEVLPGGVNSPVRAFKSIDENPPFVKKADGAYFWDEDGNKYIDFVGSWGPMILGHRNRQIEEALKKVIENGTSFGAPTTIETEMAKEVIKLVPSIEMVRFVNSGTEAVMSAIRLARAYASKNSPRKMKIIKFTGCYHGHLDALLVQAGSGVLTLGLPDSPGVTKEATANTVLVEYNNKEAISEAFKANRGEVAAIILEPVIGNAGCIQPEPGFLEYLREICDANKTLLIFDEVMTGFRVALGGAQERFNVIPDITCLGKVIGGGLPVGAYGASKEIMSMVAPSGPMYQAGTLSGNPLAMTAGLECLRQIQEPGFHQKLEDNAMYLLNGMKEICPDLQITAAGGMFGFFFTKKPIKSFEDAKANLDLEKFKDIYIKMLEQGVYFAPSAYEAGFISAAHTKEDLDFVLEAFRKVLKNNLLI